MSNEVRQVVVNDGISSSFAKRKHINSKEVIYVYCIRQVGVDYYSVYRVDSSGKKLTEQGALLMDIKSLSRFTFFRDFESAKAGPFKNDWGSGLND